jgi:hypothetical protein
MLKGIRKLNFGWIIIGLGLAGILSGFSMTETTGEGRTLLCFTVGCIYIQGVSNIVLGVLISFLGIFLLIKK